MQLMPKKVLVILAGVLVVAGAWRYGYPAILSRVYDEVPAAWQMDFRHMTIRQINSALGEPGEVASVKEYQSWLRKHWWGTEELKVIAPGCCAPESRPSEAYYVIHASGFYEPVVIRRIR